MNWGHIIIAIVVVVALSVIWGIAARDKSMTKKEGALVGAIHGAGCAFYVLYNVFIFVLFIAVLYMLYTWIFG